MNNRPRNVINPKHMYIWDLAGNTTKTRSHACTNEKYQMLHMNMYTAESNET